MKPKKELWTYECYECDKVLFRTPAVLIGKKPWLIICVACMKKKYPKVLAGSLVVDYR
jgi:hypothetical protein